MKSYYSAHEKFTIAVIAVIIFFIISTIAITIAPVFLGIYPFGPERTVTAKVERLYVDYSRDNDSQKSHYMVGTDQGVFEVNNSFWLWIWNADEVYSRLKEGKTYELRIKGQKVINMIFQEYPGIIEVKSIE